MNTRKQLVTLLISAILSAVGIIIALFMPIRVLIPPATYTLGSHIVIFIAMFISPQAAFLVSSVVSVGFFVSLGPVVGLRALSHVLWAVPGAFFLKKFPKFRTNIPLSLLFNFVIAVIHGLLESLVVLLVLFGGWWEVNYGDNVYFFFIVLLGLGGAAHSMVDFILAQIVTFRINFDLILTNER